MTTIAWQRRPISARPDSLSFDQIVQSGKRMLQPPKKEVTYALEGSVFMAGAIVQWLRDNLGMIQKSSDIEDLARQVESSEDVVLLPAFTGLGAPYWRSDISASITGMSRGTTKAHIARAALEAVAY